MRKLIFLLVLACILVLPGPARSANSSFQMGLGAHYLDYKEDLTAPNKSTETGWLPSIYASYEYKQKSFLYGRVYTDYAAADVTFDGTTQGGTPVKFSDNNRQSFFKLETNIGYVRPITDQLLLIPYTGYGFRYWERGQANITATYRSYRENYYWSYIPLGVKADYAVNEKLTVTGALAAHFMFGGRMKAYSSDVVAGSNNPEFTLGDKVGFYAEIPVAYRITPRWSLVATPWYEYSAIGSSDTVNVTLNNTVVGYAYEPSSRTHQFGIRLGASFSF